MYINFSDNDDIAMRYEGLTCAAFNCKKYGGPNNIAHQEFYNNNFIPNPNKNAIDALKAILEALINKADGIINKDLTSILESLDKRLQQQNAAELIDYVIKLCIEE